MTEWFKLMGDFVVTHGKVLFEKRRRVWGTLLIAISTGIIDKFGWVKLESPLDMYNRIFFIVSVVATILWLGEYILSEISIFLRKRAKQRKKEEKIREMVEGFNLYELQFLVKFDEKSKRAKVEYYDKTYHTMKTLGVVKFIETYSIDLVHIELADEYKDQYCRFCERLNELKEEEERFWESLSSEEDDEVS